jgi:biotin synthase
LLLLAEKFPNRQLLITFKVHLFKPTFFKAMSNEKKIWETSDILEIYHQPLLELVFEAAKAHRLHHDPNQVQISSLISIKTGGCPEDCGYCPQAARYHTDIEGNDLMSVQKVKAQALRAKEAGSSRVCLGAAWRNVKDGEEFDQVLDMVRSITKLEMEVCCTLGMLTANQAKRLEEAGLYAYNHNIDSSEEYYKEVISTRAFEDRMSTIKNVRKTSITLCSGGIIGMGESLEDRAGMLKVLANMTPQPESVPINALVPVEGTPLEEQQPVSIFEMVRRIATTRIVLPRTQVRLSAGRTQMSKEGQTLCFMAGANSIFAGDKLLTTPNPDINEDMELFNLLGIKPQAPFAQHPKREPVEGEGTLALGEKPKWTRPGHKIERNEAKKGKTKISDS